MESSQRRSWVVGTSSAVLLPWLLVLGANADVLKPIRIVVPFPPGGGSDPLARMIGRSLGKSIGATVIVDNRPGASGSIGLAHAAKSVPDGHTLVIGGNYVAINAALRRLTADPTEQFAMVSLLASSPLILVSRKEAQVQSLTELVSYAQANPGKLNYGTPGVGTPMHVAGELLNARAHLDMLHVGYQGASPAVAGLLGGQTQLAVLGLGTAMPLLRSDRVTPIAITSAERSAILPAIPTFSELGIPGVHIAVTYALYAPKATPAPLVNLLSAQIRRVLGQPLLRDQIEAFGLQAIGSTPEELSVVTRQEIVQWREWIRELRITE